MKNLAPYRVIIFDLEGPLIRTKSGDTFRRTIDDWEYIPGRIEHIQMLLATGKQVAIATNQAGPAWREALDSTRYPSIEDICFLLNTLDAVFHIPCCIALYDSRAAEKIDTSTLEDADVDTELWNRFGIEEEDTESSEDVFLRLYQQSEYLLESARCIASIDPTWRKPGPGMVLFLRDHFHVSLEHILFVGDREEDHGAALSAGVDFCWAYEYFFEEGS